MNRGTTAPARARSKPAFGVVHSALLDSPAVALCFAALAVGWLAQRLFFRFAPWLWARQAPLDLSTVNPWMWIQVTEPDGAEPAGLISLVVAASVVVCTLGYGLKLASARVRCTVASLGLVGGILLFKDARFVLPESAVGASFGRNCLVVLAAVAASFFVGWRQEHRRTLSVVTALGLAAIVLVPSGWVSPGDAATILAPALRLLHGAAPAHVYMQYDYLPSLLLEGWLWLGGQPAGIFFLTGIEFYAFLVALFILARRWFAHPGLAGPLLVALVIVRVCAGISPDVATIPQVSPLRLDLWIVPVALALRFGLRHWAVALALGLTCIFSRSIGVLYLGGYGLALGADFLGAYLAIPRDERIPLRREFARFVRQFAPNVLILLACTGVTTALFGSPISDAALLYRRLGLGQIRVVPGSFYWWLLPLTALTAGLAFWQRGELGDKRGSAQLLMAGLTISSSIYFFGRSHENNLVNLSASFLTCCFLCLDLQLLQLRRGALASTGLQVVVSSLLIALCAWHYSGKIWTRALAQLAVVSRTDLTRPIFPGYALPRTYCNEIAAEAPSGKVYFFSDSDFWYYADCGVAPEGYMQPMVLEALKAPLLGEMNRLLDQGYTVTVRKSEDFSRSFFADFLPQLIAAKPTVNTESAHYRFIKRKYAPADGLGR